MTALSLDPDAVAEDLRRRGTRQPFRELVQGEWFVAQPLTPLLSRALDHVEARVASALDEAGAHAAVVREQPLIASPRSVLVPDLLVVDVTAEPRRPVLVVELRHDSTDRYALGVKRLAYQLAGIPLYWFLEPRRGQLLALRFEADRDEYGWPPEPHGWAQGTKVRLPAGTTLPVAELFVPGMVQSEKGSIVQDDDR